MRFLLMPDYAKMGTSGYAVVDLRPMACADDTLAAGWKTLSLTALPGIQPAEAGQSYILRCVTSPSERADIAAWLTAGDAPADGVTAALSPNRSHPLGADRVEDFRIIAGMVIKFRAAQ